ncbi:hypothetical protein P170DRAFT_351574 [Aspergillus steynii IBT 23096]|uniref:Proteophosphoglycan 5 n=1 Tax=Aspergillus steynii IBT 23096 TaxID=1392250 RepID=A0A2I2GFZ5_9EURO|nr:uncharacterized protein P170DRAFT_351574 [Aspergillus steynii IBT 23096]PLB51802.1 hypothetical protein P170DRAFT_351574 [Aspergillus steynii IBT 23096]
MSTQSPTPPTPKGPRNNNNNNNNNHHHRRNQKRNMTPSAQKVALVTTPPSSPPRISSPGDTTTDSSNNVNMSKKKPGRSNKKPRDAPRASPAQKSGHRHTSSHPNNAMTPQLKDSPHYAGPTFHASPAPSALPIPSFFSKSMPDSDIATSLEPDNDNSDAGPDLEFTPSKPKPRPQLQHDDNKSTPLDFLFKAAVEARNTQPQSSPEPNKTRTPQTDSKTLQQRKAEGVTNGIFSLEMESPKTRSSQIGPSFATPYKDRMNALRSASSPSPPMAELDEDQRRAKTEALKSLLLNPRPQRPSSASTPAHEQTSAFKERPSPCPSVPHFATPLRTSSGPPAISPSYHAMHEPRPCMVGNVSYSPVHEHTYLGGAQPTRAYNPAPRKENLTSIPGNTGDFTGQPYRSSHVAYDTKHPYNSSHSYSPVYQQSPSSRPMSTTTPAQTLDTKKMEDDLRRVLKLNVSSGFPSNGIQSSYA